MSLSIGPLECRVLSLDWKEPLIEFLTAIREANETDYFYPHPFTEDAVEKVILNSRNDLYYILSEAKSVLGYGMLRGWDEGFEIPSLGIAIHPAARNAGLGRAFMYFLHGVARRSGARKIRLRVRSQNSSAVRLYESLGYDFGAEEGGYLVGILKFRCLRSGVGTESN